MKGSLVPQRSCDSQVKNHFSSGCFTFISIWNCVGKDWVGVWNWILGEQGGVGYEHDQNMAHAYMKLSRNQ